MVGHTMVQGLTSSTGITSSLIHIRHCSSNSLPSLPSRCQKRVVFVKASLSNTENNQSLPSPDGKSALSAVLDVPRRLWKQTLRPLGDFGFGRRSIWEGGVGFSHLGYSSFCAEFGLAESFPDSLSI